MKKTPVLFIKNESTEILTKSWSLIANPANWITGTFATDREGNVVAPTESSACKFCAVGAVKKVCHIRPTEHFDMVCSLLIKAARRRGYGGAADLNDSCLSHEEVYLMFQDAILLASDYYPSKDKKKWFR